MGWNVAMLVDRRAVTAPSFEKMKEPMRKALVEDMRKTATANLRAKAAIIWHTEKPPGY
jgi:transposase